MLKRKYQSGGKPNPKRMNVESGNLSGSDTGNLAYDEGIFVKDEKSGKYLETSKEDVERLIAEGKIDPRNTDQIKYGINNLKRDNAVTKEDRTDFDRFKTSNKLGFNYNESGQLVDRMGRAVDEDYMSNMSNSDKRQLGKSYKQAEMNEKTGMGKLFHSVFGSKANATKRGLEGTERLNQYIKPRIAYQVPNYKKEETTPTQQPVTTPDVPVEYKNDIKYGEIKKDKAGYSYMSVNSDGKEYVVYAEPGKDITKPENQLMTNKAGGEGDTFNKKGYGQGMEGRQKYLQDFYYGRLNQGTGNRVTSGGGSGTSRNKGLTRTNPQTTQSTTSQTPSTQPNTVNPTQQTSPLTRTGRGFDVLNATTFPMNVVSTTPETFNPTLNQLYPTSDKFSMDYINNFKELEAIDKQRPFYNKTKYFKRIDEKLRQKGIDPEGKLTPKQHADAVQAVLYELKYRR